MKFWSNDSKSLVREGSGYWKYIPTENGIKFLTYYDYSTRFGMAGKFLDTLLFRPIMRWATAWSFDRLRLWLEKNINPEIALQQSLIYMACRLSIAFVWFYHGLIPKILFQSKDEITMLTAAGINPIDSTATLTLIGWGEIIFGLIFLITWRIRVLFLVNIAFMICALIVVAMTSAQYLKATFNPVTLEYGDNVFIDDWLYGW